MTASSVTAAGSVHRYAQGKLREESHFTILAEILPCSQNDMGGAAFFCYHFLLFETFIKSRNDGTCSTSLRAPGMG